MKALKTPGRRRSPVRAIWAAAILAAVILGQTATCRADDAAAAAIRRVLDEQVKAWNAGDVETFMRGYKDSPDTTFIGTGIAHGYQPILERYKKAYAGRDAMGSLDFSEIAVRELDAQYAVVTGRFHLARNAAGGGDVSGIFSLLWEKTPAGWKIILDHSSVTKP